MWTTVSRQVGVGLRGRRRSDIGALVHFLGALDGRGSGRWYIKG
jgi:hypothetical protein